MTNRKGLLYLIEALPRIVARVPATQVLLVGPVIDEKCKEEFCQRARVLGVFDRLKFLGKRTDVSEILSHSDVFALPSIEESFPLTILESMTVGTPVVASNVGGVSECVERGVNGLLVPPQRPDELAAALIRVLTNHKLRRSLSANCRSSVLEDYSLQSQFPKIVSVFEDAIESIAVARPGKSAA